MDCTKDLVKASTYRQVLSYCAVQGAKTLYDGMKTEIHNFSSYRHNP